MEPVVTPGDNVYFMSGRLLGQVVEVRPGSFAVTNDSGRFWLMSKVVFTADNGRVTLICEPDGLANYRIEHGP